MPSATPGRAAVHINGPALRVIRQLQGVEIADLVAALECSPGYLSKLETGKSLRCSPAFLSRLCAVLGIDDRRAVLACPHGTATHADHVDDGGDTAPMPRPVTDPAGAPIAARGTGRHRRGVPA